jgi:hypothetical protein
MRKGGVLAQGADPAGPRDPHPGLVPWQPSDGELAVAHRALAVVPGGPDLLYARVDLIDEPDTGPTVMELELIEPNLFLGENPGSAAVLANAIVERANR